MSEEGEQKTDNPNDQKTDNPNDQKTDNPNDQNSSEDKKDAPQTKNDKESRFTKTFQVFQQMGLLEYALQVAKLCKENEQLQLKINKLEMEVNESSQKAKQDLQEKLQDVPQNTTPKVDLADHTDNL